MHAGFSIPEAGNQEAFLGLNCGDAAVYSGSDYYERLWPNDADLELPTSLGEDLDRFASLSTDESSAFARASYWFSVGLQFRHAPAVAKVAMATAIECLLPRQPNEPRCKECGKPQGPGPTKHFANHIRRYAPVLPALADQRDELYAARSALVHGSHADQTDLTVFSPTRDPLQGLLMEVVCQRSLLGWLRDPNRPRISGGPPTHWQSGQVAFA
jgi:hypothetical protein